MTFENRQRRVAAVLAFGLGAMLTALAGYLVYILCVSAAPLAERAAKMHHMRIPIQPVRGNILDSRMRVLAGSQEVKSVFADPKIMSDPADVAARLAPVINVRREEIFRKLTEDPESRFVWLVRRVKPEVGDAVRRLGLDGIALTTEGVRNFPNGQLAAHVLGFVGVEEQGLEGIEKLFDERLRGKPGMAYVLADRRRRPIWIEPDQFTPSEDGQHLVLTIDATIQAAAEEAVAEAVKKFSAVSATAVVLDPETGAILALANVPTYDPNRYAAFSVDARRNRALTDTFPPGSNCKPCIAAAAIEAGSVRFGQVFNCESGYWAAAKLHDAGHSYGNLTIEEVLIKSSNIGMAKVGLLMGNEKLHAGMLAFGYGRKSGVWLPAEDPGLVWPLRRWGKLSTTRCAFGQEFTATPLQMTNAFAALANGGKLLRPKILRGILDSRGQVAADLSEPEVIGQAVSAKVARHLIDKALVAVVEEGTGKAAQIPGYRVFGKTGTAQKIDPETRAVSNTRYMGSFLCGAPAHKPQVVVGVFVNEPEKSKGYYGGTVAAPAAQKILQQTLTYLAIPPTEKITEKQAAHLVRQDVRVTD